MNFEFAKYTEITDFAHKHNPEYAKNGYVRVFICADVNDFWLARILANTNEDYEHEEGCFLLERDKIPMEQKGEKLSWSKVRKIVENDEFENWDVEESDDIKELIEMLDDGFGIINLKEKQEEEKF